jgi:hypothetical protein
MPGTRRNTAAAAALTLLFLPIPSVYAQSPALAPAAQREPNTGGSKKADGPAAGEITGASPTADSERLARVKRGLATELEVDFQGTPVKKVIEYLNDMAGVDVQVGKVDVSPYTVHLVGRLTIEQVLDFLAKSSFYDWGVQGDKIVLVPEFERVPEQLFSELYDVEPLLLHPRFGVVLSSDLDRLEKALLLHVDPASWDHLDGGPTITTLNLAGRAQLLVRQSARNHVQIERLLKRFNATLERLTDVGWPKTAPPDDGPPPAKPAGTGTPHGLMLTGLFAGEEVRMKFASTGCFHHAEYALHFHGDGRAEVTIQKIVALRKAQLLLGTVKLNREDRIGLNNWLAFARGPHGDGCSTSEYYEIRWLVDGEKVGTEVIAFADCSFGGRNVVSPWNLIALLPSHGAKTDAPILVK